MLRDDLGGDGRQGRCLRARNGSATHRAKCISKGSVLATRAAETQGKGTDFSRTKATENTQGEGIVFTRSRSGTSEAVWSVDIGRVFSSPAANTKTGH